MENHHITEESDVTVPIYLGRQPIIDLHQQIYGHELLFRSQNAQHKAIITDSWQATATVIVNTFAQFGLASALGAQRAFINVDEEMLLSDFIDLLPRDQIVLEILESVSITPPVLNRCRQLREQGWLLALDDIVTITPQIQSILPLIDIAKVQISAIEPQDLSKLVKELSCYPCTLLAEQVETQGQMENCQQLGFSLFQGYFFARPTTMIGKRVNYSRLHLLKLIAQLMQDADIKILEESFKQEASLAVNLLRLANAAAIGVRTPIQSLRHAITILGRNHLKRWLQLLLYTDPSNTTRQFSPLLHTAATRGRFLELLVEKNLQNSHTSSDQAFLTGMLSLTPALFNLSITEILDQLPSLSADVREALLSLHGELGVLLNLACNIDGGEAKQSIAELLKNLPDLNTESVLQALAEAIQWVNLISHNITTQDVAE